MPRRSGSPPKWLVGIEVAGELLLKSKKYAVTFPIPPSGSSWRLMSSSSEAASSGVTCVLNTDFTMSSGGEAGEAAGTQGGGKKRRDDGWVSERAL